MTAPIAADLISLSLVDENFESAATNSRISLLFTSFIQPLWKQPMGKCFSGAFAKLTTESVKVKNVVTRGPRVLKYKFQWTQQVASLRCRPDLCMTWESTMWLSETQLYIFYCLQEHCESPHLGIAINLVRAVDHAFTEILDRIPQFLCGMLGLKPQTYYQT